MVPVLYILQACVNKQQSNQQGYNGLDAQTLEEVRNDWCSLVGETDTANEGSNVISEIIPMILLDETSTGSMDQHTSKNRDSVSQAMEMSLAARYKEVVCNLSKSSTKTPHCEP